MDILLFHLLFLTVFQTTESDVNVGEISCKENAINIDCPFNGTCSGSCRYTCADIPRREDDLLRQVWGTTVYNSYSSICKAATHDFRISTWDATKRSFILKKIPYDENYWASIRSGIRSYSSASVKIPLSDNTSFIFLSPRVNEQIQDVASIHKAFIFGESEFHVQTCLVESNTNSISFRTFIPEAISGSLAPKKESWGKVDMYNMPWPKSNGEARAGGFQCVLQKSMLSVVTSLAMSSNADFHPTHLTYVSNVNDDVTLEMKEHSERSSLCAPTWKKDDEELPEFVNQPIQQPTSLFLPDIQEGSQGLYSLGCETDSARRGFLRLIVRACPADKYGDNCTKQCPECENGGFCHDITGVCICPPGFNGTSCENACPAGYFGQTCSMTCPESGTSQGKKPLCKGYLICFPDPYGCSCAPGYKGISCNESYPVLTADIILEDSTSSSLTISFPEWDSKIHTGNGTPSTYKVFYKRNGYQETWISKDVIAVVTSEKKLYKVTLENLEPDTEYAVRVVILDVSGKSQEEGVKEHVFSTPCGRPMEPPSNISISAEEREVFISWELPLEKFWACRTITSIVKYSNSNVSVVNLANETFYKFISKPYSNWSVIVCIGQGTQEVTCAEMRNITTKEDAPGEVKRFYDTKVTSRSIYLKWEKPLEQNGVIRYFSLQYQQRGWIHNCQGGFRGTIHVQNISSLSFTIRNLNPSAIYEIQIRAVTVKEGPPKEHPLKVFTKIDVPSGSPGQLEFSSVTNVLQWEAPPCAVRNGDIKNYRIILKGLSFSDHYQRSITIRKQEHKLLVLPATKYNAKVFASTNAGFGKTYAEINFTTISKGTPVPAFVTVTNRTDTSFSITWIPPPNIDVNQYQVSLDPLDTSSSRIGEFVSNNQQLQTNGSQVTFSNLAPATAYMLTIAANTIFGYQVPLLKIVSTRIPVPEMSWVPVFFDKTKDTITIKILPVKPVYHNISYYFVIMKAEETESKEANNVAEESFFAPSNCHRNYRGNEYVVARLKSIPAEGRYFRIGDGSCTDGYSNKPLPPGTYQVGIVAMSQYHNDTRYSRIVFTEQKISVPESSKVEPYPIVIGVLVTLIVIVCILIIIFALPPRILRKARQRARQSFEMFPWRRGRGPPVGLSVDNIIVVDDSDSDDDDFDDDDSIDTESISEDINRMIPVKGLEKYIVENLSNGELKKQFKSIPRRHTYPCHAAKLPLNRIKNRYGNLLPYDTSRVKLKPLPQDASSEYINANYICGYKNDKKYIATQGPLPKTITDFWRMVWNENACKVFMVTNLMEQGRIKCERYWPEKRGVFGFITVTLTNSEQNADYVIRTFEISTRKQKRELKQFHYLTWPDHGAPSYASTILRFLKKAKEYQPNSEAPIIVHCSAGVGRTGTTILLDSMLEMGMAEGQIDICGHLCEMRKGRINLVENMEQFVFVHKALEQALCWGETSVLCADLVPQIGNLRAPDPITCFTALELQYQRLAKIVPRLDNASMRIARLPENKLRNRTMDILPPERSRPILQGIPEEGSSYINAVYIPGYKEKDAFLATQYPLPNTICEFWKMIYQTKSRTIVLLQDIDFSDPTCPQYWPSEGHTMLEGDYRIQCVSVKLHSDIRIWTLNLSSVNNKDNSDESPVPIKLFHHLAWTVGQFLPNYTKSILDLIDMVERTQREGKHVITVQCLNGSTASGVFCAAMCMCSKMIYEQEVDIFMSVQNVKINRPQFIENFEQYDFLYDLAITFLDNFGAYANFL